MRIDVVTLFPELVAGQLGTSIIGRAAEAIIGRYLEMPPHDLPEGAFYWDDLIGLDVRDIRGEAIGELVEIFRAGENEVYRIVGPRGERLVPALRSVVLEIDLDARRMTVADDDSVEVR